MRRNLLVTIIVLPVLVLLVFAPIIVQHDPYMLHIFINMGIGVIMAVTIAMILSVGEITIAHAAFMAIGAYTSALLTMRLGVNFWLALPASGMTGAIVALLIGLPLFRLKRIYFAICSAVFGIVVYLAFGSLWIPVFGGCNGIANIPPPDAISIPGLFRVEFTSFSSCYYILLFLVAVTVYVMYRIANSRYGKILQSIAQADTLAQSVGINLTFYKLFLFSIACFFASIAGSYFAHTFSFICPAYFTLWNSIYYLIYAQVGGVNSVAWPAISGFMFPGIAELLRPVKEFEPVVFGLILIVVMYFLPAGLASLPEKARTLLGKILAK